MYDLKAIVSVGLVLFVVMIVLNFIPGGRTAGQVPLRFAMENLAKEAKLESLDNEREMEEFARRATSRRRMTRASR